MKESNTKPTMLDFLNWEPTEQNEPLIILNTFGQERIAIYEPFYGHFHYTDRTHARQQSVCYLDQVVSWRYADQSKMDACLFERSERGKRYRERVANEILSQVSPPSKFQQLIHKLKSIFTP